MWPQDLKEQSRRIDSVWRKQVLACENLDELIIELIGDGRIVHSLDHQAQLLRLLDLLAGFEVDAAPHTVRIARGQLDDVGGLGHAFVAEGLHRCRIEDRIFELDHRKALVFRQSVDRAEKGLLIKGLVHHGPHEVRGPTLQGAAEDSERPLRDHGAAEVTHRAATITDRPEAEVDSSAGRQIVEPDLSVEELTALVGRDQVIPASDLTRGQRLHLVSLRRRGGRVIGVGFGRGPPGD
ncbi:MAG: hypothetical protein DME00_06060, partial [Candidatus Rokuibacteriota bacterium]